MYKSIFVLFFTVSGLLANAQISEVEKKAKEEKKKKPETSNYSDGDDSELGGVFTELIVFLGYGAQTQQLQRRKYDPWIVSLETHGNVGFNGSEHFNSQSIRFNWGLLSTQLRRFDIRDDMEDFTTLDWQIVQLNVINRKSVRWVAGLGSSYELDVKQTHVEFVTELYLSFFNHQWMPSLAYRISDDGYPRQEYSAFLDYRPFRVNKTEVSFRTGYVYQKLYDIPFHYFSLGVGFYLK